MKTRRWAIFLLLGLYLVFAGTMVYAAGALPERVATHFGWNGEPNGWMSRSVDLIFMSITGFGLPLFLVGICYATRFIPRRFVNLPHRDYWLAPERRDETSSFVGRHSIWLACMMLIFLTMLHLLVVLANRRSSPTLPTAPLVVITVGFLAGTGLWIAGLLRHFSHVPRFS